MSHLPISSNIGSVHKICLVHMIFFSALQIFCNVLVFRGLNPPFLWVKMAVNCSHGAHIGAHRLIFLGLIVIVPTLTVVSLPG